MIRNVVVGHVRAGVPAVEIEKALQGIRDLRIDGAPLPVVAGLDLGLRDGNASFAITVDFPDEAAYRAYDIDAEHNRVRAELFAPICERIDRIQFRI
ncbi:MAG: Dabb family protein [Pseudonocardia sp.]|nr:Dabb family protein [Pseudonocardia sp.]